MPDAGKPERVAGLIEARRTSVIAANDTTFITLTTGATDTCDLASGVTLGGAAIVTPASTSTFTNKTFDANATGNSITNIDLTADVINDLPVTEGGTGASVAATALTNLGGIGAATSDTLTNKTIDANATGNSVTNIDLTADVINDLPVAEGGTGVSTLTDGGVLLGSGTGAITAMAVLSDSEMIVGDGTTDPVPESGTTLRTSIGVPEQADQAALEGETNENTYAPPDLIKHSPGVAKVWVEWEAIGAHSITASYNMTSVTDGGGAGDTDHVWNVDFSSGDYATATGGEAGASVSYVTLVFTKAAGTMTTRTRQTDDNADVDLENNVLTAFGDQ